MVLWEGMNPILEGGDILSQRESSWRSDWNCCVGSLQKKRSLCQGKKDQYFHRNAFALRSTLWDERQKEPGHPGGGKTRELHASLSASHLYWRQWRVPARREPKTEALRNLCWVGTSRCAGCWNRDEYHRPDACYHGTHALVGKTRSKQVNPSKQIWTAKGLSKRMWLKLRGEDLTVCEWMGLGRVGVGEKASQGRND